MTDLDILGVEDTAALSIVGTTDSLARRLMQKVLILLIGPAPEGYDLLAKLRGSAPTEEIVDQYLQLGRQTVLDALALTDKLSIRVLTLDVADYAPPSVSVSITLSTTTETVTTTVEA